MRHLHHKIMTRSTHAPGLLCVLVILAGACSSTKPSGPPTANETSEARTTLAERVAFVERYVTFRRHYTRLDYDISYHNNGGGLVPGPSDWDVRLRAVVPCEELSAWTPGDTTSSTQPALDWALALPGDVEVSGVTTWYITPQSEIGVDTERCVVAYRHHTR